MTSRASLGLAVVLIVGSAEAAGPPSCPNPGGGAAARDCHAEFASQALRLNFPPHDPMNPVRRREVRCFDGDAGCDADGVVNGECRFPVDVCLLTEADPALPGCPAATPTAVEVAGRGDDPDLAALQTALEALLPASASGCTSGQTVRVPLRRDGTRRGGRTVTLRVTTSAGRDLDRVKLGCMPRGWPSHGYDHANRRATPTETILGPGNASRLEVKWHLDLEALEGPGLNGVTSTPAVGNGLVYVSAWNSRVYALRPDDGKMMWRYDAFPTFIGFQSSPTLTPDGRLLVGDSLGALHCLDARTGRLLWKQPLGEPSRDHMWASPQVANGRVFIGVASHSDQPCTKGRLFAVDLDTGTPLWTVQTVPDNVCAADTTVSCTSDADCGGTVGSCTEGRGAGITATVAVDPTGETVYMATVGCFTSPSIGDSESIFALDAATGAVRWKHRTAAGEQVADGPPYHDYGFLNGPVLVDADDGAGGTRPLVVAASKDGSLYALDPDGVPVWIHRLIAQPEFAGFGLLNGAIGFAGHTFYAALNAVISAAWPPTNDHLFGFRDLDGAPVWSTQIGASWSGVGIANGLLFVGTNDLAEFYVHDAATGARLATFPLPETTSSGAAVADGRVYVGYGIFSSKGGVLALGLD